MTTAPHTRDSTSAPRPRPIDLIDLHPPVSSFRGEVLAGLKAQRKTIPPKYFYDERGSELFDRITRLPEYYPTRTEIGILEERESEIESLMGGRWELVELGSGSSRKVKILLDAAGARGIYVPIDISREHLRHEAENVARAYPGLRVTAVCADYTRPIPLGRLEPGGRRIVFFPGSTIGNFEPSDAGTFLRNLSALLRPGDFMIVGVDLKKDPGTLHAAYNDAAGVTAKFNLNLLHRINRELSATFDVRSFEHVAFYDVQRGRIEMHLRSRGNQVVRVAGEEIEFAAGEMIHTENSYKYDRAEFGALIASAGLETKDVWTDRDRLFSVWILKPGATRS